MMLKSTSIYQKECSTSTNTGDTDYISLIPESRFVSLGVDLEKALNIFFMYLYE